MIKIANVQIEFFNTLNVIDCNLLYCKVFVILYQLSSTASHYVDNYTYAQTIEAVNKVFSNFSNYFIKEDKNVKTFLLTNNINKTFAKSYKILTLKNGVKKYCKYKFRKKKFNDFKIKLKKIKWIDNLNNWLKGRK